MPTVLFLTGSTRGDALGSISRGVARVFEPFGYDLMEIELSGETSLKQLEDAVNTKDIAFAFAYAAFGRDVTIATSKGPQNLWEVANIPFISVHGDSPAYFFDRHVNPGPSFANLYGFREHYLLRKTLPKQRGIFGVVPPMMLDVSDKSEINFAAKAQGKLFFPKNGNDPEKLKQLWRQSCSAPIADLLLQIADLLDGEMDNEGANNFDEIVTGLYKTRGIDVDTLARLRLFFIAQLDDYFRRIKSTMMAEVLMDFPVEIHGENWEHLDFSGKKCSFVPVADYKKSRGLIKDSLGMIDMSPNTGGGFHDRPLRAYGMYTLCLTNEQECMNSAFGENPGFTFAFNRDAFREKVAEVLAHPKDFVELGMVSAEAFRVQYTLEAAGQYFLDIVAALRLASATQRPAGLQDFFIWPPQLA